MILVLSYEDYEQGTDPVIDWLLYHQVPFLKITLRDLIKGRVRYQIDITNGDIRLNDISVRQQVRVIWNRRFMGELGKILPDHSHELNTEVNHTVRRELTDLVAYLSYLFSDKIWLTTYDRMAVNKLEMLNEAQRSGLAVPMSRIINNCTDLQTFMRSSASGLISKTISNATTVYVQDTYSYGMFTHALTPGEIDEFPPLFFPTLFQEKIRAQYEIRAFYIDGQLFPTAIVNSSPNKSTDRKLDSSRDTTHFIPCQLPPSVESSVRVFMERIGLNTGGIDLIRDTAGTYYFLEVNPVGQYLAESSRCNYHIEQHIAEWLINKHNCHDYVRRNDPVS